MLGLWGLFERKGNTEEEDMKRKKFEKINKSLMFDNKSFQVNINI